REYWPYLLGGIFILGAFFPQGVSGGIQYLHGRFKREEPVSAEEKPEVSS
ncbi:MAG: hypothetical protein HRT89_04720, partial [Lentisphaeria bacterium]|nr:hypothetical protein [Lentisphaeria bacterium]